MSENIPGAVILTPLSDPQANWPGIGVDYDEQGRLILPPENVGRPQDRNFQGAGTTAREGLAEQLAAQKQARDRGRLYSLRSRDIGGDGYEVRRFPGCVQVGIAVDTQDAEHLQGLEEAAEKPRADVRVAFKALQESHKLSDEAQALQQIQVQLTAAETALDLAKSKISSGKGQLRRIAREGGDHEQVLAEIKNAEGLVEIKTILISVLEAEVRDARTAYEEAWQTKLQDFIEQHRSASQARSDAIERGIVRNLVPALVSLQAARDAEMLVTSVVFSRAEAPDLQ
jgi:hypothetical protein